MKRRAKRYGSSGKPPFPEMPLSPSYTDTLGRLADLAYKVHGLQDESALRAALRLALTKNDKRCVAKLTAGIESGDVTEDMLQAWWKNTAASHEFYVVGPLTRFVFEVSRAIEQEP